MSEQRAQIRENLHLVRRSGEFFLKDVQSGVEIAVSHAYHHARFLTVTILMDPETYKNLQEQEWIEEEYWEEC